MRKNIILGVGAVCFVVVFVLMTIGAVAIQQFTPEDRKTEQIIAEKPEIDVISGPSKAISDKQNCSGDARCISGFVTRVIDGDTIDVDGQSIRFALVDTPEFGENEYAEARNYIQTICPIGSAVIVDEDDLQTKGSHGRIIGVVYCNYLNLSEEILEAGHAEILTSICLKSEFANEPWAKKFGC